MKQIFTCFHERAHDCIKYVCRVKFYLHARFRLFQCVPGFRFYFHPASILLSQPTFPFAISFHTLSWKQFDNNKLLSQFAFGSSSRKKDCFLLVKTLKTLPLFAVALACNTTLYRLCTALVLGFGCVLIHAVVN